MPHFCCCSTFWGKSNPSVCFMYKKCRGFVSARGSSENVCLWDVALPVVYKDQLRSVMMRSPSMENPPVSHYYSYS